jgi:zona occludens toxin
MAGRRVLSNIDGLSPDAIRAYCLERVADASELGTVALFHGDDARKAGFWPDEEHSDTGTVVKGGDLVVFDEWALAFPRRGNWPDGCNVEAFLRWHRHLNGADGTATDIAIGTQLATDVHQNVRGLIVKSYKFRKLTALGAQGQYTWQLYEGHLQPKGGYYRTGTGTYDKQIFPLYASSAAAKEGKHVELRTNKKESIWSGGKAWAAIILPVCLLLVGSVGLWRAWHRHPGVLAAGVSSSAPVGVSGAPRAGSVDPVPSSSLRIVGYVGAGDTAHVIVSDDKGLVRIVPPSGFAFEGDRPVSGMVDGQRVVASDIIPQGQTMNVGGVL